MKYVSEKEDHVKAQYCPFLPLNLGCSHISATASQERSLGRGSPSARLGFNTHHAACTSFACD